MIPMTALIRLACAVVLVAAVSACGDGAVDEPATSLPGTTDVPATTAAPPTTVTEPSASTTISSGTDSLAEGSGCTPGEGDLGDGRWFGYVAGVGADSLEFDLACFFSGEAAALAAAEDGAESPPPNDYYVRNANDQIRAVDVDPATEVLWYPNVGDPTTGRTDPYATWVAEGGQETEGRTGAFPLGVWLTVEGGAVVHIEELWVP